MFRDGPDVSLNGSPMVSPITAASCASSPFLAPSMWFCSIAFFALSQAPPAFAMNRAIKTPVTREPASRPPSASGPSAIPTISGAMIATIPGPTISLRAAFVEISTQVWESGLTPSLPSRSPGISLNCLLISTTIAPAAFPTEVIVIAATTNGRPPPIRSPITT